MTRHRGQTNPFLKSRQTQWLLLSAVDGDYVAFTALEPGTDLRRAFVLELETQRSQGWILQNEANYPCVFMQKDDARRMLSICRVDPREGLPRHFSPWKAR